MMLMFIVNPIYFSMQYWSMKHLEEVLIIYSIAPILKAVKKYSISAAGNLINAYQVLT